jgi:hypothetical protein
MKLDEKTWKTFQQHVGYNDEEMKRFRENPRNEDVLSKSSGLMNKTIVAKVVESRGCNSRHKVGDKLYKKYLLNTAQLCWADENRFAKR